MKFKLILLSCMVIFSGLSYAGDQIIVKLKSTHDNSNAFIVESGGETKITQLSVKQIKCISDIVGHRIHSVYPIASGAQVVKFDENLTKIQMEQVINKLKAESSVEYVVEDSRLQHMQNHNLGVQ